MVRWIIQQNISELDKLVTACENNNIEYELVFIIPFDTELPIFTYSDNNMYYGSINFINNIYEKYKPNSIFYNNNFSMENYINKWGSYMLNSDAIITNFKNFCNMTHTDDSMWFIRPDADDKSFAGEVYTFATIKNWSKNITRTDNTPLNENTKIIVSEPYNIVKEWRNYIINGKVITSSLYRKNFKLNKSNTDIPSDMIKFVEDRCKEYTPHDIFVMDIALCGGEYYIIECGCINSVGLYASDVNILVREITNFLKL
jgi:hypothetical protein